jgi:hypothetical protein
MCGTDYLTHVTPLDAVKNCYRTTCNVATYYEGSCGCPNGCYADFNQGVCANDGVCRCNAGWGGRDCSFPVLGNSCGLHGKLMSGGDKDAKFPFDYCVCDAGFTGIDCSSTTFKGGVAPWGSIFDSPKPYTSEDKYHDNHPIWNISELTIFHVELPEDDYVSMITPANLYNEDNYTQATVHVSNSKITETYSNVGLKIKGDMCRRQQKKCWAIKFNEFISGQKLAGDVKKISFKAGTSSDDILIRNMIYTEFLRALVLPTQRASYGLLYINNMFVGFYFIYEDIGDDFIVSRIENDHGENNLFKLSGVYLRYYGSDPTYYQNSGNYELDSGPNPENWNDLINWLAFMNESTDKDFNSDISKQVELSSLWKSMIIESFLLNSDGMSTSGKNFYSYHLESTDFSDHEKNKWLIIPFDFDFCFEFDDITWEPSDCDLDIINYFIRDMNNNEYNPLFNRLLNKQSTTVFLKDYLTMYSQFITATFGSKSAQQPSDRWGMIMQFILPWITRDKLWQLSNDATPEGFTWYAERSMRLLQERYQNVTIQINNYLSDLN